MTTETGVQVVGTIWQHKARGTKYVVASMRGKWEPTEEGTVRYISLHDHSEWLRPTTVFLDGRFEQIINPDLADVLEAKNVIASEIEGMRSAIDYLGGGGKADTSTMIGIGSVGDA